jgi:hypothetical protein
VPAPLIFKRDIQQESISKRRDPSDVCPQAKLRGTVSGRLSILRVSNEEDLALTLQPENVRARPVRKKIQRQAFASSRKNRDRIQHCNEGVVLHTYRTRCLYDLPGAAAAFAL